MVMHVVSCFHGNACCVVLQGLMLEVEKYAPNIDQVAARANGLHPDCNQEQKAQLNNIVTGSHLIVIK